jgi:hypothetical protein
VQEPFGDGAVAEENARDVHGAARLQREGAAERERHARADDPVRAEHPDGHVGDMHRTAPAAADAVSLPHQLQEEGLQLHALGEGVSVAAMVRGERIGRIEGGADPDRDRFLADAEMDETRDFAVGEEFCQPLLGTPDEQHPPIKVEYLLRT